MLAMGVNTMSYMWRASARQALETLAREGYKNFEVMAQCPHFDPFMERQEALAFGRFLRDAGLSVETINIPSLDQNLASGTPQMREHTVNVFKRLVDIAETIGSRGIVVVTGRVNPLIQPARAELEAWVGDAFERVLRYAEPKGIYLLLENIPMGVFPRADQLIAYAQRLGSAQVEICYDIANAHFIGEDAVAGLKAVAPKLGIVHLSDTGREAWRHDPVGQGSCDFAGFGAALKEIHYKKTSMLEIVSGEPLEDIISSHQTLVRWGWKALR